MKNTITLNKILLALILGILFGVTAATAVFIKTKSVTPGIGLRKIESKSLLTKENAPFDMIGQLRITSKIGEDEKRHVLVLCPWLEYNKKDRELFEELDRKLVSIKSIFTVYFSSRTKEEVLSLSEEEIKQELLSEINANLVLGKVEKIYFKDYIFLN